MGGGVTNASEGDAVSRAGLPIGSATPDRPRYQPLVIVFAALAAGMIGDRYSGELSLVGTVGGSASFVVAWFLSAAWLGLWWVAWRCRRDVVAGWLLLVSIALLGAAWNHLNWFLFSNQEIARFAPYEPQPACIEGIASQSAERVSAAPPTPLRAIPATEGGRLLIEVASIRDGQKWRAASGLCEVSVDGHLLGVHAGDLLRVYGQLARPAPPLNPGEFDFAAHARADRLLAHIRGSAPECVVRLADGSRWSPRYWLDQFRSWAKQYVRSMIGPQRAGLAAAILLGAREGLPYQETEAYLETGTIHVLVVSGMNVAILAVGLLALMQLGWLPRRIGLSVIIATVITYTLLAEAQPPVMRAAVLGVLACIAIWIGRSGVAFNSIFAAALVVLAINPSDLFRAGPQLSFLAVAALIWCGNWASMRSSPPDPLQKLIESVQPWHLRIVASAKRWAFGLLLMSTAVWLLTLPLVLSTFHILSPIAIPASLIVWPLVWVAMWSGFLMVVIGWAWLPIGHALGVICKWSLSGLENLVQFADHVPAGHFWAPGPAWWWVAVFYAALMFVMVRGRVTMPRRWQLAALALWILVGLTPPLVRTWTRSGLDCSFVAVGHGACVVMESPDGQTLLYDAGAIGSPESATQSIASYLWHRGIMRIDGIVISHADIDHYNAVPGLLQRFHVGAIYVSPVMNAEFRDPTAQGGVHVLHDAIKHAGVPIREIWSGDHLRLGSEVNFSVFHPPRTGVIGSDNANSITMAVEYAGHRMLLPGDLESPGIEDLMAEEPYDCDILLAPHHGSRRSDPPGFAAWSTPNWVVVSGGGGDEIDTVKRAYSRAGAQVVATVDYGTIGFHLAQNSELRPITFRPLTDILPTGGRP